MEQSLSAWNWISWNLTKFQLIQFIQTIVIFIFSIGCLIELKFCKVSRNSISKWTWKFQHSILKNKKVLFLKKIFLGSCQYQNKKALFTDSIFQKVLSASAIEHRLDALRWEKFEPTKISKLSQSDVFWQYKL